MWEDGDGRSLYSQQKTIPDFQAKAQGKNKFQSSLYDKPLNINQFVFEQVLLENTDSSW